MCIHCCGPDSYGSAKVDGVRYWWDMRRYTGPQFYVGKGHEPFYPDENHGVWLRFNRWLKRLEGKTEGQK